MLRFEIGCEFSSPLSSSLTPPTLAVYLSIISIIVQYAGGGDLVATWLGPIFAVVGVDSRSNWGAIWGNDRDETRGKSPSRMLHMSIAARLAYCPRHPRRRTSQTHGAPRIVTGS